MTIYWQDTKNGDDANDGLTPETAVRTEARLAELVPAWESVEVVFVLGDE